MLLASNKVALFDIVIARSAPLAVQHAADELQRYAERIALAQPRILTDEGLPGPREIVVGDSAHRARLFPDVEPSSLAGEEYVLKSRGSHLLVLGGTPRGTLYAVYDLLERLGVRWWTPWEEHVPSTLHLECGELDVHVRPPLIYRALWYRNAMDADWQARQRLNAGSMGGLTLRARHGGCERFAADATAHTYELLVPTEKYFDEHPEYFCEVNGERLRHQNQLCPTHPVVAEIAAQRIRWWLTQTPEARIASVTQNDWGNWCTCTTCAALIEQEGTPAAPALHLANEVAKRLEKDFPDLLIDTFAYGYTEKPPKRMQAHPKVLVRLAPIGNCFGHSIRTCEANKNCREALEGWSKIARQLFVWHYVTDFFHYLMPFPNLPPLAEDIRTYVDYGVRGVFLQGDGTSLGGDLSELKAYLMCRLMWEPHADAGEILEEFLRGYYRAAARGVREYLSAFEKAFKKAGPSVHLFLYRSLWQNDAPYLERGVLREAWNALERARKDASDDPQVLERLDRIEAGWNYSQLFYHERSERRVVRGGIVLCPASRRRQHLAKRLFEIAARSRFTHYAEDYGRYTTFSSLRRVWLDSMGEHRIVELRAGEARLTIVPDLGGRILSYSPAGGQRNLLNQGSPETFGYPCIGGYEEYSRRAHQSPGFSEKFRVVEGTRRMIVLQAELETGLRLVRRVELTKGGEVIVETRLMNPTDATLPGCLRPHLEIDLDTAAAKVQGWLLRGGKWFPHADGAKGVWYDDDVPQGWAFWSPVGKIGLWQRWEPAEVKMACLGTVPSEPKAITLDLLRGRSEFAIDPGGEQRIVHRFGRLAEPPMA